MSYPEVYAISFDKLRELFCLPSEAIVEAVYMPTLICFDHEPQYILVRMRVPDWEEEGITESPEHAALWASWKAPRIVCDCEMCLANF